MITTEDEARSWFRNCINIDILAEARLETFAKLLIEENERQNLISKATTAHVWARHFADSAQLLCVPRGTSDGRGWLDLGTGAGFPGLVIAICRTNLEITLVDSRRLRANWLCSAVVALGLNNAKVVQARVESLPTQTFSTISARAFAPLDALISVSERFSTPDTLWLLPKGAKAEQELSRLSDTWHHMFHVKRSITDPRAGIIAGELLGKVSGR